MINPGEAALGQHEDVRESVVVAREIDETGGESDEGVPQATDVEDIDLLLARMMALGDDGAMQLVAEVEGLSLAELQEALSPTPSTKTKDHSDFAITLKFKNQAFVRPPRESQRAWLLNQALAEWTDDLVHLDRSSRDFVSGAESRLREEYPDIAQARLGEQEVMEEWQVPIMKAMARHVGATQGDILEIGFGRGVSAGFLQEHGIRSHTIVESNTRVIEDYFEPWKRGYADRDIRMIRGRWQDVLDQLETYDGIFFHAFPLNEAEFIEYMLRSVTFAEHFFPTAAAHLKAGGVFCYLSTEIDSVSRRHQRLLFQYFSELTLSVEPLSVPENTHDAWWADSMVIIKCVK